jgi:hypothetical protein
MGSGRVRRGEVHLLRGEEHALGYDGGKVESQNGHNCLQFVNRSLWRLQVDEQLRHSQRLLSVTVTAALPVSASER